MAQTLQGLSQSQYDASELLVIDQIRTSYPGLDLRLGTTLRELLVRPEASVSAQRSANVDELQATMSLSVMATSGTASAADVDAILSNFNMALATGNLATGTVMIKVVTSRVYSVGKGFIFETAAGLRYQVPADIVVAPVPIAGQLPLFAAPDGTFYFIVPVVAAVLGSIYNIQHGTALTPASPLFGYISSSAYVTFSGGTDSETVKSAINRIPAALSHRGLVNKTATEAQLRDVFTGSGVTIQAVSIQGYGDAAQIRDKHNVFGVAVGGRVDVYCRTFQDPMVYLLQKTGTRIADGTYQIAITAQEAPGFYAIRAITDVAGSALGSYQYTELRGTAGLANTFHDIDPNNAVVEAAYTVWQTSTITITGVPDNATQHIFKVEAYGTPGIQAIQTYMDDPAVRPVTSDYLVRCPLLCLVSCTAQVFYPSAKPVEIATLQVALAQYINSRSFVSTLTRSELVAVMLANGVTRINLGLNGMTLDGRVRGADGTWYTLRGDTLDIGSITNGANLLAPATCCFAAEQSSINIAGIAE